MYYLAKILVTTALVVAVSEVAKRSSLLGAVLASVPLVSVLAMLWIYRETGDSEKIIALSSSIFWLVLPSLVLFILLPLLLKAGMGFYPSLGISVSATVLSYLALLAVLGYFGIRL